MPDDQSLIFVSYSREDSAFALQLTRDLKSSGASVWLDQLDIPTGVRWDTAIEEALARCTSFLVVLSPASVASENVRDEIDFAIGQKKKLLPSYTANVWSLFALAAFSVSTSAGNISRGSRRCCKLWTL